MVCKHTMVPANTEPALVQTDELAGPACRFQATRPSCRAIATAWVRLRAPSFTLMLRRCAFTVVSDTNRRSAISRLR